MFCFDTGDAHSIQSQSFSYTSLPLVHGVGYHAQVRLNTVMLEVDLFVQFPLVFFGNAITIGFKSTHTGHSVHKQGNKSPG